MPLEEATTPSLEALKAFSTGQERTVFNWERRLPHYQRAVAIDPDFALAHAQIGFGYSTMGETALGRQSLLKAYQLRHRASDVERFNIETLYDRDVTGNLERERRDIGNMGRKLSARYRASFIDGGFGPDQHRPTRVGDRRNREGLALDPDRHPPYGSMALNQLSLNRLDDALLTVRRATERKLGSSDLLLIPYFVAYLKGDDEMNSDERRRRQKRPRGGRHDLASGGTRAWLARAGCKTRDGCPRSPSRSRSGRVGANGPACSKRPEPCGKRFTATRPPPGRAPARRSRLEEAATWTMPRRSRWPSQVICGNRAPSPRISRASSRRIRRFNSCICRRFGPCSH